MNSYAFSYSPKTTRTPRKIKIESVITCVNYADILAHTLPLNYRQFDKTVVVTAPEDKATQKVVDYYTGVQSCKTDAFRSRWGEFCKGAGINAGLDALDKDAWILHLDADIILPPNFREVLENADLDTTMIYGADRAEFKSYADWQAFYGSPEPHTQGNGFFIHITHHGQQLGTRIAFQHFGGYVPIGFFQLWHADSKILRYPQGHTDAGREDSVFPTQWPRSKRALIPEIVVYHLESEAAEMGINWHGRKSKPFGGGNGR
jgi:hypothetical protein